METLIGQDVERAADWLRQGELVGLPTETVYGLAGNALNPESLLKIFKAKDRPLFDPLILHLSDFKQAERWCKSIAEPLARLAEAYTPGPLTFVLPKQELIPDLATAGLPTVAIRVPAHPLARKLLSLLDFPLAAPSANPFGYVSPTEAAHVKQQLDGRLPYILDGGPCEIGLESTIVTVKDGELQVLRLGGMSLEAIEHVAGPVQKVRLSSSTPEAPGQLSRHYATRTSIQWMEGYKPEAEADLSRVAFLGYDEYVEWLPKEQQYLLSPNASLDEAASKLFGLMRELDSKDYKLILVAEIPNRGLGRAINDRLTRAMAKN